MSAPPPPSGRTTPGFPVVLAAVVVGLLAIRLIVGAAVHLTEDEAYYRLWSMKPAFGYYDHPPMISWWIWLGRAVAGDTALGVRLPAILAAAAGGLLVFDLARLAGADERTARRAGVWFNAMPLVTAGGFLAVPDAPASLFWILTLWSALKARRRGGAAWWIAAGAAGGLAALSKYSALFLGPGVFMWLAWTPDGRARLRTAGPWLAALIAAAIFGLNVAWNADHHWLTFAKQFGRVVGNRFAPWHLVEFVGLQVLLINPLIAAFALGGLGARRRADPGGADLIFFVATSAPFILYLLVHSLHDRVQAHWPVLVYPAIAICAAVAAARLGGAWTSLKPAAPILGFAVCAAALALVFLPAGAVDRRFDPASPVRGWPAFARQLEGMRVSTSAAWVGTTSYGLNAQLADETALRAPTLQLDERERYAGLETIRPDLSRPGVVVDLSRRINPAVLARCFGRVEPLGRLSRGSSAAFAGKSYAAFLVSDPRRDVISQGC